MNFETKDFIIDLIEGSNEFDLEEYRETKYDTEELIDSVVNNYGIEGLNLASIMYAVLEFGQKEFIEKAKKIIAEIEDENDRKILSEIGLEDEEYWSMYANGLDNHFTFITDTEEQCELMNNYLCDLIEEISDKVGFCDLIVE